jgi:CRP/FNR family transcriptional regulator
MYYDSFSSPESGLPPELFAPFFSSGQPISYRRGQIIYLQGQEPEYLYCLSSGSVRTGILSDQGEEKILTIYQPGSIFGEASFFDGLPRVSTATAQQDCQIVRLSHDTVDGLFRQSPALASAMITYLARTVRLLSGHVDTMSFQAADKRLANLLLNHPSAQGDIHVTHEELASALGVSRVTVSRILGTFSRKGYVETGYGFLRIRDPQGLGQV